MVEQSNERASEGWWMSYLVYIYWTVENARNATITSLKDRLRILDSAIEACSKQSPDLSGIVAQAQPKSNTGTEGTPLDSKYFYKGYELAVLQDPNSPAIAPRRYAVAKDNKGTVVLKGQSSFSSDTQVLLDEIKFRIDNQLP